MVECILLWAFLAGLEWLLIDGLKRQMTSLGWSDGLAKSPSLFLKLASKGVHVSPSATPLTNPGSDSASLILSPSGSPKHSIVETWVQELLLSRRKFSKIFKVLSGVF